MSLRPETELKEALRTDAPLDFVRGVLFGDDCWLFEQRVLRQIDASYQTLKQDVSRALDINPKEVTLIGSAKIGFSIAPGKTFRPFRKGRSDLDLAIVSPRLFGMVWASLSEASLRGYSQYADTHARQIFSKFVILESDTIYKSTYLSDLSRKTASLNRAVNENVKMKHKVNYRIYADLDAAEGYHVHGINELRKELARG